MANIIPFSPTRTESTDEWDKPHPLELPGASIADADQWSDTEHLLFWANDKAHPLSNEQKRHLRMVAAKEAEMAAALDDPQFRWVDETETHDEDDRTTVHA